MKIALQTDQRSFRIDDYWSEESSHTKSAEEYIFPTGQNRERWSDKVYFRVTALLIKPDIIIYFRFTSTFAVNSVLCMRTTVSLISLNVSTNFFFLLCEV